MQNKEKQYFIYLTTNLINNKKYIGYHYGCIDDNYLGSGTLITKAIKQYGKENFSRAILEICKTKQEVLEKEKHWIFQFNAVEDENFYNISAGGEYDAGWEQVKQWRNKNPDKAKEHDEIAINHLRDWEKSHPQERQQLTKNMLDGAKNWRENNPDLVQQNMIKVNQAKEQWQKEHPQEYQNQIDNWRQAGSIANSQKIICITTGEIFESISEAARQYARYGCTQPNISKVLKGERKSCGKKDGQKLKWKKFQKSIDKLKEK